MRVTLIDNSEAGDEDRPDGAQLVSLLRAAGHEVHYQPCVDDTWSAALDEPADVIAVAGGDGTVGRVAKRLIGRDIPVAPLPLGTANNIAKTLRIDEMPLEDIVAAWPHGRVVTFDAGVATGPWGSRYFVEGAGIGLFARTMSAADRSRTLSTLESAEAKIAYARKMLRERLERCAPQQLEFSIDGSRCAGEYVLFEAMNMEFVGPNLYLAPGVDACDGKLDLALVTLAERDALAKSLEHADVEHPIPEIKRQRGSRVAIEWTGFELHFDDEAWPGEEKTHHAHNRIELSVEREALRFLTA